MSSTIDERVVSMKFDNKNFEDNVSTSLNTLDKLKQSLRFDGISDGFSKITKASDNVSFSALSNSVEAVKVKFSALEAIAVGALTKIGQQAITAAENTIKAMSGLEQIQAGWTKFGEKTTSVGTLISQGYDLDTVNEQLERLNWFTDETSYNFTDMVSNIAKFTASGQDLETSVTALEGIANWAALSGQNATTASNAMYQLSQAMGAGVMRKEDYKSIQNASMDTDEFRQKALDAAVALGTLKENADGTYESLIDSSNGSFTKSQFADHLTKDAWFTSDVMMEVFNEYSGAVDQIYEYAEEKGITASEAIEELGDQVDSFGLKAFKAAQEARTWSDVVDSVKDAVSTGWMQTFENIFGNYEEAKTLWTNMANELYEIFAEGGNARNEMLGEWKELGGRTVLINSLADAYNNVKNVIVSVKDAFREIFPAMDADRLYNLTLGFQQLVGKMKLSDTQINRLTATTKSFFSTIKSITNTVKTVVAYATPIFSPVINFIGSLLRKIGEVQSCIQAFVQSFNSVIQHYMKLDSFVQNSFVINVLARVLTLLVSIAQRMNIFNLAQNYASAFASAGVKVANVLATLDQFLWTLTQEFKVLAAPLVSAFEAIRTKFIEVYYLIRVFVLAFRQTLGIGEEIDKTAEKSTLGKIIDGVATVLGTVAGWLNTIAQKMNSVNLLREGLLLFYVAGVKAARVIMNIRDAISKINFKSILSFFSELLQKFKIKEMVENLVSFIKNAKENFVTPGLSKVGEVIDTVREKLASLGKIFSGFKTALGFVNGIFLGVFNIIKSVASSIGGVLNNALKTVGSSLSDLGVKLMSGDITSFIKIINNLLTSGILYELLSIFAKFKSGMAGLKNGKINLCQLLFGDNPETVTTSFSNVCTSINNALSSLTKNLDAKAFGTAAKSIAVLAASLFVLSLVDSTKLTFAAAAIGALFLEVGSTLKSLLSVSLTGVQDFTTLTKFMTSMAISIGVLAIAIRLLSSAKPESLAAATSAVMATLLGFTAVIKMMSDNNTLTVASGMKSIGGQLIAFAASIWIISSAIKKLAKLDTGSMYSGLIAIIALMGVFTSIVNKVNMGSGITKAAIGMLAFASAISTLALAMIPLAIIYALDPMALLASLGSLIALMASFAYISKEIGGFEITKAAIGIMAFALSIDALALAMVPLAIIYAIDPLALLASLGGLLAMMVGFAAISKIVSGGELTKAAIGMLAFAVAIDAITLALIPLAIISSIDPAAFVISIVGLAAVLLSLVGISKLAGGLSMVAFGAGLIVVSAGLVALSVSMVSLSIGLQALGSVKWTAIVVGLITLAATLAIIGAASVILAAVSPIILLLSVSIFALGAGLLFIASAGVMFAGSLTAILSGISGFIIGISQIVITSIPTVMAALLALLGGVILTICQAIAEYAAPIAKAVLQAILSVLLVVGEMLPQIMDALIYIFTNVISEKMGPFVDALLGMLVSLFEAFANGLVKYEDRIAQTIVDIIEELLYIFFKTLTLFKEDFLEFGGYCIDGLVEGISAGFSVIQETVTNLGSSILGWFRGVLGIASPSKEFKKDGKFSAIGYQEGINEERDSTQETVEDYAELITDTMDENVNEDTGADTIENWTSGMNDALKSAAPDLASTVDTLGSGLGSGFITSLVGSMGTTASSISTNLTRKTTGGKQAQVDYIRQQIIAAAGNNLTDEEIEEYVQKELERLDAQEEAQDTSNSILTNILDQFSSVTSGLNTGTIFDWSDTTSSVSSAASDIDTSAIQSSLSSTLSSGGSGDSSTISDLTSTSSSDTSDLADVASSTSSLASSTSDSTKQMNSYMQTLSKQISNLQSAISNLAEAESRGNWYNTFSIEKASDPTEVADEVAAILQKQIERSYAKWA